MVISCMLGLVAATRACLKDSDCLTRSRPDVHSMFCVNNVCQKVLPPGKHCTKPTECSSYSFFGPLACTGKCKIESECEYGKDDNFDSMYCCRSIPEGKECNPDRPASLNGCDIRQSCLMGKKGFYECVPDKSSSWIFGVFLSVSGNIGINVGINLQKKSYKQAHMRLFGMNLQTFYAGCFTYGLGKILGYCSYVFGNQSLIAALSATGLVSNSIFAPMINEEVFTWKDFCAIFFAFAGTTLIVMNTAITHRMYTLCELMKMYRRTETLIWFGFIVLVIVVLFTFIKYVEVNSNWELPDESMTFLRKEGVWFDEEGVVMKYTMVLAYVCLSSFIASFTTLSVKSLGEMIDKTIAGDNQFIFLTTYLFIMTLAICTFFQIYWLNRALRHYDALLVIPMFHVTWTLLSILTAGIYFREFEQYTSYQLDVFAAGVGMIFVGSFFLGSRITNKTRIRTRNIDTGPQKILKNQ
ncbi:magnesium transporter NIPA [Encephalitozoon cuniculi]|nr:magnesium transporter NIPA [Encephalitozoon cuniculi]